MKRTTIYRYSTLGVLAIATALLSPSALHAQNATQTVIQKYGTYEMLRLMTDGTSESKPPIVILDTVRADKKALTDFAAALYRGRISLGPGGVRVLAGDSKEAEKYGAKAGDRVIIVSTSRPKP